MSREQLLILLDPRATVFYDLFAEFLTARDYNNLSFTCAEIRVSLIVPSPWGSPSLYRIYTLLGFRITDSAEVTDSDTDIPEEED